MRKIKQGMATLGLACVLGGCAAGVWYGNPAQPNMATIHIGMTKDEARSLLGPPSNTLAQQLPGVLVETWKYTGRTLIFHNGVLQSVVTY